jgi:hypothetical protein
MPTYLPSLPWIRAKNYGNTEQAVRRALEEARQVNGAVILDGTFYFNDSVELQDNDIIVSPFPPIKAPYSQVPKASKTQIVMQQDVIAFVYSSTSTQDVCNVVISGIEFTYSPSVPSTPSNQLITAMLPSASTVEGANITVQDIVIRHNANRASGDTAPLIFTNIPTPNINNVFCELPVTSVDDFTLITLSPDTQSGMSNVSISNISSLKNCISVIAQSTVKVIKGMDIANVKFETPQSIGTALPMLSVGSNVQISNLTIDDVNLVNSSLIQAEENTTIDGLTVRGLDATTTYSAISPSSITLIDLDKCYNARINPPGTDGIFRLSPFTGTNFVIYKDTTTDNIEPYSNKANYIYLDNLVLAQFTDVVTQGSAIPIYARSDLMSSVAPYPQTIFFRQSTGGDFGYFGYNSTSIVGTITWNTPDTTSTPPRKTITTPATANSVIQVRTGIGSSQRRFTLQNGFVMTLVVGHVHSTNMRWWVGLASDPLEGAMNRNSPLDGNNGIIFGFATPAGHTTYRVMLNNGQATTPVNINTGISLTNNLVYYVTIRSIGDSKLIMSIRARTPSQSVYQTYTFTEPTDPVPSPTTQLGYTITVATTEAVSKAGIVGNITAIDGINVAGWY